MAQQTAVEWLIEQLPIRVINSHLAEIAKAKTMEREQIIDAFDAGTIDDNIIGNEYFDQTFNKKQI